ncbi:MAG: PEP-CTERM sorting domain-containing protein [Fischerella sp.]|nr:PEP-CTERM sorting domain-containing protein [Fischerella sp.]
MTDLADKIGAGAPQGEDPLANKALLNSLSFATKNGKGFIGEFNGAGFALSQNTSGFSGQSLELVPGTFTGLGNNITQPFNIVQSTHPVTAGLPNPWTSSGGQDFLASSTGVPSELIVAKGPAGAADQFPTIVASRSEPVPEPLTMSGTALAAGMGWLMKRKLTQSQKAKV